MKRCFTGRMGYQTSNLMRSIVKDYRNREGVQGFPMMRVIMPDPISGGDGNPTKLENILKIHFPAWKKDHGPI